MIIISAWITVPTMAPIPAHPMTLTFGSNYPDIHQQEEAEAQEEQEEAGSNAETLEEGLGRTRPCKGRGQQELEVQDRRDTGRRRGPRGYARDGGGCK